MTTLSPEPMIRVLLGLLAVLVIIGAAAGGYVLGHDRAVTESDAAEARKVAFIGALGPSSQRASVRAEQRGEVRGLDLGRDAGGRAGASAGAAEGATAVEEEQREIAAAEAAAAEEAAAAAEAARLSDAADSGYEDDGGAYDPTPPSAGSYGSLEAFCADQPEETECGGPGDPAAP